MPLFTGKSSQGSKPTTWFSFTLSWIPHCTPQKQQWVLTSLSGSAAAIQPPAGCDTACGPYRSISASRDPGVLAILHPLDQAGLGPVQLLPLAGGTDVDVQVQARCDQGLLQVGDVHRSGEPGVAASADRGSGGLVVVVVEDYGKMQ